MGDYVCCDLYTAKCRRQKIIIFIENKHRECIKCEEATRLFPTSTLYKQSPDENFPAFLPLRFHNFPPKRGRVVWNPPSSTSTHGVNLNNN